MDLARIGHIGAEVAVVGGLAYFLMQQNKTLQTKVDELEKKLQHVALHTRNLHQDHEVRFAALEEKLKKGRERPERAPRAREILRATAIDDDSPPPVRPRASRRLPAQEPSSPVATTPPATSRSASPLPAEDDEESDPEAVLKR